MAVLIHHSDYESDVPSSDVMDLTCTADYHQMLIAQAREHLVGMDLSPGQHYPLERSPTLLSASTRQWIAIPPRPHSARTVPTAAKTTLIPAAQLPSQSTLTREEVAEFQALPMAIRRKYFSTSERLRFAQSSGLLSDDPEKTPSFTLPHQDSTTRAKAPRHRKLQRSHPEKTVNQDWEQAHYLSDDSPATTPPLLKLPKQPKQVQLSREKQVALARQLRQSVILDAADEAILRVGRRTSRRLSCSIPTPGLSSGRPSMESQLSNHGLPKSDGEQDLFDSFRWLDEDDDLDLRLYIGDYHANLRETLPMPVKEENRLSFRRHLSLSKNPFGRSSLSSSRPATKDTISTTATPTPSQFPISHKKRKSRALSLVTPKHAPQASVTSIDPAAAHYQDPEARLKLRVYLASPQNFDEAIEFGFPSVPAPVVGAEPESATLPRHARRGLSDDSERFKTFLSDDKSSTYSEDLSFEDPESPTTPHTPEKHPRKSQPASQSLPIQDSSVTETNTHSATASREMTLRMTLTRPDLRACEDQIYGWQQRPKEQTSSKIPDAYAQRDDGHHTKAIYAGSTQTKQSFDKFFANLDEEAETQAHSERGAMKRFWDRVRRN